MTIGTVLNSERFTQGLNDKMFLLENFDSNVKFWRMKILVRVYESKNLITRSGNYNGSGTTRSGKL